MTNTHDIAAYSLVADLERSALLVVDGPQGWSLPWHTDSLASEVTADLRRDYGVDATVLARGWELLNGNSSAYVYFCTGSRSGTVRHTAARWRTVQEVLTLKPAAVGQRKAVAEWAGRHNAGRAFAEAPAWAVPGWFDEASRWMRDQAEAAGLTPSGPVGQYVVSPYSCTLRLPADGGLLYFKAAPQAFAHEPRLVQALSEWFPDSVPRVVAIEADRHWLLTRDIAPYSMIEDVTRDIDVYAAAVSRYAQMQVETAARTDEFLALGLPDRRLPLLPDQFEDLVADTALMLTNDEAGLSDTEYRMLRDYVPVFRRTCERLASYGMPETLQNTDFWRDCIAISGDRFVFLDWAESILGHPLYSLTMVLRDPLLSVAPDRDRMAQRLIDTYLSHWAEYLPEDAREEAFEVARPGGIVCRALAWRDCLSAPEQPDRYEVTRGAVARNMRALLSLPGVVAP
ncbi:hypothetical protein ACN27J_26145 [Solwaraspora sp. WMMB762]|uniref:hypothetical protein n=1 Tax=Solwaraspora sp. WMMB762 TaxID=3404120 RepID=UPI003B927325